MGAQKNVCLLIMLAAAFSCQKKEEVKSTEVTYEIKTFRVESPGGCTSDTVVCAYYEVSYPVFNGLDSSVSRTIAKKIDLYVSMGNPEAEGKSMKEIGSGFIGDFEDFNKEMPDQAMGWHYVSDIKVEQLIDTLLTLSATEEYFTGGAHGGYGTYYANIDPRTGKDFSMPDFFKPGYEDSLVHIAEQEFRKVRDLSPEDSFQENYFEFPDDKFQLNSNFGFTKEGLVFYYNSYEIAAYAAGPTEVLIPYARLKRILKSDSR